MTVENLFSNPLVLAMLSGGGASLAGEDSVAAGINPLLQGAIATQSKAKEQKRQRDMLSKLLGKGVDFSSSADGRIKVGAEDIKKVADLFGGDEGAGGLDTPTIGPESAGGNSGLDKLTQLKDKLGSVEGIRMFRSLLNPNSSSPDVPAYSDLVGLTPQDMSQALAGAQQTELLKHKISSSLADAEYKKALKRQATATAKKTEKELEELEEEVKKAPFGGYTMDEWETFPSELKAYIYSTYDAKKRGDEVPKYDEWAKSMNRSDIEYIYNLTKKDPDFKDFVFKYKAAGAPKLGPGKKVLERSKAEGQAYFERGDFSKDVRKHMELNSVRDRLFRLSSEPEKQKEEREKIISKFIENEIKARGGRIISAKYTNNDKTMVWTVKWNSGKESEVRYDIGA